jgi:hypothetical protein
MPLSSPASARDDSSNKQTEAEGVAAARRRLLTPSELRFMWHQRAAAVFNSLAGQTYYAAQVDHFLLAAGRDTRALAVHSGTVRSCVALVGGLLGPSLGSASDTFGRRPLLVLWNLSWLLRPLAFMVNGTLRGRLITEICCAVLGAGGGAAQQAAFADFFGQRPELSAALQAKVAMWSQLTNLLSASVGRYIAVRWGLRSTFVASAIFASISLGIVSLNPETMDPRERRPMPKFWKGLKQANPVTNIWLLFSHGKQLRNLGFSTLFFSLAGSCNANQDSYRLGALQWSPLDIARYLQFTPPMHGLLQGHAIEPMMGWLGTRRAGEIATLVCALGYVLWGTAWRVPGSFYRAMFYGASQVLLVNTWVMMSDLSTQTRLMRIGMAGTKIGKGELSAALAGLRLVVGVATPPLIGHLYSYFTSPGRPFVVGASGVYYCGSLLFLASYMVMRTVREAPPHQELLDTIVDGASRAHEPKTEQ